jgi:hypothetical protein
VQIAALAPTLDIAGAGVPLFGTALLFFAGQVITFDAMPKYWYWFT